MSAVGGLGNPRFSGDGFRQRVVKISSGEVILDEVWHLVTMWRCSIVPAMPEILISATQRKSALRAIV
jgi:hypothetical protein